MEQIVLVGFLPDGNGRSCDLHPFGCGNSLVLNRNDYGVGTVLRLQMFVSYELHVTPSVMMVLMDAAFVSHLVNLQQGKMGVGWMGRSFVLLKCSPPNRKTGP